MLQNKQHAQTFRAEETKNLALIDAIKNLPPKCASVTENGSDDKNTGTKNVNGN